MLLMLYLASLVEIGVSNFALISLSLLTVKGLIY